MSHSPQDKVAVTGFRKPAFFPDHPEESMHESMTATDFVIWLSQHLDVLSDTPPSQAEWDEVRSKIAEQVGSIVARRIQHKAKPYDYGTICIDTNVAAIDDLKRRARMELYRAQVNAFETRLREEAMKMIF